MLKKAIKFTDFDGNEQVEEHYFYLSRADLVKLELGHTTNEINGLSDLIQQITTARSGREIIELFEEILRKSYGKKSPDGKRFIKTDQLFDEFSQGGAYEQLFFDLTTDAAFASEFIRGIFPKDISEELAKRKAGQAERDAERPDISVEGTTLVEKKLSEMSDEEIQEYMAQRGIQR